MTRPTPSRPSAELERQLDAYTASARANGSQRWKKNLLSGSAYAAAAGSALAFTTAADAGIIYSGTLNATVTLITFVGSSAVLKKVATGTVPGLQAKMSLRFNSSRTSSGKFRRAGAASLVANGNFQVLASGLNLLKLQKSSHVPGTTGELQRWPAPQGTSFPFSTNKMTRTRGSFAKGVTGFAGFRFAAGTAGGQPAYDYGWIRLKWTDSVIARYAGFPQFLTVIDWAYNDVANARVHVGDIAEPSTLLLGAHGCGRERRAVATAREEPRGPRTVIHSVGRPSKPLLIVLVRGLSVSTLLKLLDIRLPILQAPMAGVSTPAMAAAVSNAGGLGAIGVGATDAETARRMIRAVRTASDRPFNVNVFCHRPAVRDSTREAAWLSRLAPIFSEYGRGFAEWAPRDLHELRRRRRDARHAPGRTAEGRQFPFRHPGRTANRGAARSGHCLACHGDQSR